MAKAKSVKTVKKVSEQEIVLTDDTIITNKNKNINLKEELFNTWKELLVDGKTTSKLPMAKLIENNFKAIAKCNNDPELSLKALKEIKSIVGATDNYFNKTNEIDKEFSEFLINKELLEWQKGFFTDKRKNINLLAGRRAGKSYGASACMIDHCLEGTDISFTDKGNKIEKPRAALYIGLTIQKAKEIMWEPLIYFLEKIRIPVAKIDKAALRITFQNGSYIQLAGNSNKNEREKVRGTEWSLVIIDECQSQDSLRYLLIDILGPIIKGRDSKTITMGTAPLNAKSYWEEICLSPEWSHYHATLADNETIPNRSEILKKVLQENGWDESNVIFRREYLGEIAYDTNLQVFPIREYYDEIPVDFYPDFCVCGVDYGFADSNAIIVIVGNSVTKKMYLFEELKFNRSDVSTIVKSVIHLQSKVRARFNNLQAEDIRFFADTSDQSISRELWNCGVNIENAYKVGVDFQIARLNELMRRGILLIKKDGIIDDECGRTIYKYDKESNTVIYEIDDKVYHPDAIHALRYAIGGLNNTPFFDSLYTGKLGGENEL